MLEARQAGGAGAEGARRRPLSLASPALVPTVLAALAAVGLAAASVYRHDQFGSNAYDLGIYDQMVWG